MSKRYKIQLIHAYGHPALRQLQFETVTDRCNECTDQRVIWDTNIRYILCHYYGPAKLTYRLKYVQ